VPGFTARPAAFVLGGTPRQGPNLASLAASLDSAGFPIQTQPRRALSLVSPESLALGIRAGLH